MGSKEARPGRPPLSGCFPLGLKTSPSFWTCSAAQSEQVGRGGGSGGREEGGGRGPEFSAGPLLGLLEGSSGVGSLRAPGGSGSREAGGARPFQSSQLNQGTAATPSLSRSAPGSFALDREKEPSVSRPRPCPSP